MTRFPPSLVTAVALLGLLLVGGALRLHDLAAPSMMADVLSFQTFCEKTDTAGEIFTRWEEMQVAGHLPFAAYSTKLIQVLSGQGITHFSVRLSSALWGVLAILAAWLAGANFGGRRLGLTTSALVALHPCLILVSRESYYYAPLVVAGFISLASLAGYHQRLTAGQRLNAACFALYSAAFFLLVYTAPSSLGYAAAHLVGGVVLSLRHHTGRRSLRDTGLMLGGPLLILLPWCLSSWGLNMLTKVRNPGVQEYWALMSDGHGPVAGGLYDLVMSYGWGYTPVRMAATVLLLGVGVRALTRRARQQPVLWLVPLFFLAELLSVLAGGLSSGLPFRPRYVLVAMGPFLLVVALGIVHGWGGRVAGPTAHTSTRRNLGFALRLSVALGLWFYPAYLSHRWTGEFKQVVQWCDAHLPAGMPVLCDRYFTAWNEFPANHPTNVVFMSTVKNQTVGEYRLYRWRETAQEFLSKNPDAAYFEEGFHRGTLGLWNWPRQHFAGKKVFVDEYDRALRRIGPRYRMSESWKRDRNPDHHPTVFYNTRDDAMEQARAAGRPMVLAWGSGWEYRKSREGLDWWRMGASAIIDVYNLTDETKAGHLVLVGLPWQDEAKAERSEPQVYSFAGAKMKEVQFGPFTYKPGRNPIRVNSPFWEAGKQAMYVQTLGLRLSQ